MRVLVGSLRGMVERRLHELAKKSDRRGVVYYCPLHNEPLVPKWGKKRSAPLVGPGTPDDDEEGGKKRARVARGGKYQVDVPEFMRPALGHAAEKATSTVRPNIIPPSAAAPELMHRKRPKEKASVSFMVCPFYYVGWTEESETGPYGEDNDPRECDFHVTARKLNPGQTHPNIAIGEVAKEFHLSGVRPRHRFVDIETPPAFVSMVEKMKSEGFRWQRSTRAQFEKQPVVDPATGKPTQHMARTKTSDDKWSRVDMPEGQKPTYTQEDIIFLSWYYPTWLGQQKKRWGSDYKGPQPYNLGPKGESAPAAERHLRKLGWERDTSSGDPSHMSSAGAEAEAHRELEKERQHVAARADKGLRSGRTAKKVERRQRLLNSELMQGIDVKDAERMLDQSESDSGNIDIRVLKDLVKQYLAARPAGPAED